MIFPEALVITPFALLLLRLIVASIFIHHGLPKIKESAARSESIGFSPALTKILGIVEVAAAVMLIVGLFTQVAALAIIVIMLGAIYKKVGPWKVGYFGEKGWSYDALLLAAALILLTFGSGPLGF